jgi:serine/threonine protein kinase
VADFGTAQLGSDFVIGDSTNIDNPTWIAPEFMKGQTNRQDISEGLTDGMKGAAKKARIALQQAWNKSKLTVQGQKYAKNLFSGEAARQRAQVSVGNKIDAWGLGAIGHNLYTGRLTLGQTPPSGGGSYAVQVGNATVAFGSNPANRAIAPKGTPGSFADSRGLGAEENLINQLLHPDKDQRPTATQILNHDAFKGPGVGSQAARDLIKALMTDPQDTEAMKRASAVLGPPVSRVASQTG